MFRNRSVDVHQFSMIPRAEIPRSSFTMQNAHKTTFNGGLLVPVYLQEVLPGDTFSVKMTAFCRLATPIYPVMDNMYLESFFFFVPNRLVWNNWQRFMGERDPDPDSSIDFLVPQVEFGEGVTAASGTIWDYFGIPTGIDSISMNAMPFRAYNLIWNEWFRDQNLQDSVLVQKDDGPDGDYQLLRRGKRHDYFTSCLPWPQKGEAVPLPLQGNAPVITGADISTLSGVQMTFRDVAGAVPSAGLLSTSGGTGGVVNQTGGSTGPFTTLQPANLYADLSEVTATTINALRSAFQIQRLLERDARGGTRYTELVRSHFGVVSPDSRLQRPEYLGGGVSPVNISPVAQTSGTAPQDGYTATPQGNLSAFGTVLAHGHGFRQSFTEHGYIVGMISVRADLSYQQGLRKLWSRRTRYDFYWPVFAALGEQAVLNKEIYAQGTADDELVFGYQERWAEYRYHPSMITGLMRSSASGTLDAWHLSQNFESLPTLNATFIEDNPPIDRVIAVPSEPHFIGDFFFDQRVARAMPMYSVPGLIDHF